MTLQNNSAPEKYNPRWSSCLFSCDPQTQIRFPERSQTGLIQVSTLPQKCIEKSLKCV